MHVRCKLIIIKTVSIRKLSVWKIKCLKCVYNEILSGAPQKINYRQKEKQILDQILGGTYDNKIRPSGANGTGDVIWSFFFPLHFFL